MFKSVISNLYSALGFHDPLSTMEKDAAGGALVLPGAEPLSSAPGKTSAYWQDGWYLPAHRSPVHPDRIGGPIAPWAAVVHTTDMHPDRFWALLKRWKKVRGEGAAAHFLLGRTAEEGLHQLVSTNRNANHAGGKTHGNFVSALRLANGDNRNYHPNNVSIGIEVMNAGRLRLFDGVWRTWSKVGKKILPFGAPFEEHDVEMDGPICYHRVTPFQKNTLWTLLQDFQAEQCAKPPPNANVLSTIIDGKQYPAPDWALHTWLRGMPVVGHVAVTPDRKGDPWPPLCRYLTSACAAQRMPV